MKLGFQPQAIIFDFDGVIIDSVSIKTQAFKELYAPYGKVIQEKVVAYHEAHGGISRYEKFPYWHQEYLNTPLTKEDIEIWAKRFSSLVFQKVLDAPFIEGVEFFLEAYYQKIPLFVCTGTPQHEIDKIIQQRGLKQFFREVHGSPKSKVSINNDILNRYQFDKKQVLFIGDAMTDYTAAKSTGLKFLGIVKEGDSSPFPSDTEITTSFK